MKQNHIQPAVAGIVQPQSALAVTVTVSPAATVPVVVQVRPAVVGSVLAGEGATGLRSVFDSVKSATGLDLPALIQGRATGEAVGTALGSAVKPAVDPEAVEG